MKTQLQVLEDLLIRTDSLVVRCKIEGHISYLKGVRRGEGPNTAWQAGWDNGLQWKARAYGQYRMVRFLFESNLRPSGMPQRFFAERQSIRKSKIDFLEARYPDFAQVYSSQRKELHAHS